MADLPIPERFSLLHQGEEELRGKAAELLGDNEKHQLHLSVIEHAMDLADILRQHSTDDENLKVVQFLSMQVFNAFGASVKLMLSGYFQNSALIMRTVLETVFLLDLFKGDPEQIERWRLADKKERMKHFKPVDVRIALDNRDGFDGKKRAAMYDLFSELAGHPTMQSVAMLRPRKDGDAVIGPFMEATSLEAVLSEMGRLAIQAGEVIDAFIPQDWSDAMPARAAFAEIKLEWVRAFYPGQLKPKAD